jgi:hypothetical protein
MHCYDSTWCVGQVISFDSEAMEQIPLYEFYAFVGPYRDKKVGISMQMKQRCCFATTCSVTGKSIATF